MEFRTRWLGPTDFQFRGIWWLLSPFFRGAIKQPMLDDHSRFKTLLESGQL